MGFKNKYEYPKEALKYKIKDGFSIYIDTREQMPLVIDYPTEVKGLKFGDYAINDPDNKCYIERKSISDFIGTMSGGYERFCREIERSIAAEANLIVLIERPLQECLSFQYLNYVSKKIKVTPEFVFFNVRELIQKYTNVQFLFVDGREECVRVMKRVFFASVIGVPCIHWVFSQSSKTAAANFTADAPSMTALQRLGASTARCSA